MIVTMVIGPSSDAKRSNNSNKSRTITTMMMMQQFSHVNHALLVTTLFRERKRTFQHANEHGSQVARAECDVQMKVARFLFWAYGHDRVFGLTLNTEP